jgi:hypothetical protein
MESKLTPCPVNAGKWDALTVFNFVSVGFSVKNEGA